MDMFPTSTSDSGEEVIHIGKKQLKPNESSSTRYALIDLSCMDAEKVKSIDDLIEQLIDNKESIILSEPEGQNEFFVLFLSDKFAYRCIEAYASQMNSESRFSPTPYNPHYTDLLKRSGLLSKYYSR